MKSPTLADEVYRFALKNPEIISSKLREDIKLARKFVLDEAMSAFMADVGWAAYKSEPSLEARLKRMDDIRHLARLPHKITWIEWDEIALATRACDEYDSTMDPELVPEKSGWLMYQHPTIETAFWGSSFGWGNNFGADGKLMKESALGQNSFGMMWQSEDQPLPWNRYPLIEDENGHPKTFRGMQVSGIMTGLPSYDSPYISLKSGSEMFTPRYNKALERMWSVDFRHMMEEQSGMARYLLGVLATINDLPVAISEVRPSKGFVAKGNYKRFLEHSTITLTLPTTRYRSLARKTVANLRRRAHQVRGHWRDNWRKPGEKIWIAEHQRGDTSLGFVIHDYQVKKE